MTELTQDVEGLHVELRVWGGLFMGKGSLGSYIWSLRTSPGLKQAEIGGNDILKGNGGL